MTDLKVRNKVAALLLAQIIENTVCNFEFAIPVTSMGFLFFAIHGILLLALYLIHFS